jgi:AcrR family transcriptional regulator
MPIDTKQLISQQFTLLFRQKGLDKVTVKELVESCHISRQAFYYHFQDILDVMNWGTQQKVKKILEASLNAPSPVSAVRTFITFFGTDRPEIDQLLASRYHREVHEMLSRSIRGYLEVLLKRSGSPLHVSYRDMDAALDFFAGGICQILLSRAGKSEEDDDCLARQIVQILSGELQLFE